MASWLGDVRAGVCVNTEDKLQIIGGVDMPAAPARRGRKSTGDSERLGAVALCPVKKIRIQGQLILPVSQTMTSG